MVDNTERLAIKTLNIVEYNKARTFPGISALKMNKKDRHNAAIDELSKFLNTLNENIQQNILILKRNNRESLEFIDESLLKLYSTLNDETFLILQSENDLYDFLNNLKSLLKERLQLIDDFSTSLDRTEIERSEVVGKEFKNLVDKLIGIAHQLSDDIEHIIENEAFEINSEIITNRKAYAVEIGELRIIQVKTEAEAEEKWESARNKWRNLRHNKAVVDYRAHIDSKEFLDPMDRRSFMEVVRKQQTHRMHALQDELNKLLSLNTDNIKTETIVTIQEKVASLNANEITAIQECYNGMNVLRDALMSRAKFRTEKIRKELHYYGALKLEPDFTQASNTLMDAVNDEGLAELWRLAGGLKIELLTLSSEIISQDELAYNSFVQSSLGRCKVVINSFNLKSVLEGRGRMAQLEKIKSFLSKMKSAPRNEVVGILRSLIPDFDDILELDLISTEFKISLREINNEIKNELTNLENTINNRSNNRKSKGETLSSRPTSKNNKTSNADDATAKFSKSSKGLSLKSVVSASMISSSSRSRRTRDDKSVSMLSTALSQQQPSVDPGVVKTWFKKLGILFYASDLHQDCKDAFLTIESRLIEKMECNRLIDEVVKAESETKLKKIMQKNNKLIDTIASYLENQASLLHQTACNLVDFYLNVCAVIAQHRQAQTDLDNKNEDEIWDLKEDFRFELEDKETAYEAACQKIRESTQQDEIQENFEGVLEVLQGIQESYHKYHSNACFSSDKYPLILIAEFLEYLKKCCEMFFMKPDTQHPVLTEYNRIFDTIVRFNKLFFDKNELAGGVVREDVKNMSIDLCQNNNNNNTNHVNNNNNCSRTNSGEIKLIDESMNHNEHKTTSDDVSTTKNIFVTSLWIASHPPPSLQNNDNGEVKNNVTRFNSGKYKLVFEEGLDDVLKKFYEDGSFGSSHPQTDVNTLNTSTISKSKTKKETLGGCSWIASEGNKNVISLPLLTREELDALDTYDKEDYEKNIVKLFVELEDTELHALKHDEVDKYNETKELVDRVKERLSIESSSGFIRKNIPMDEDGHSWISELEISTENVSNLFVSIRESVFVSLEKESFIRILTAEKLNKRRKKEFTDNLEDQIRNHWPRRGRVETMIKQPREAELLGHKEKTWRHIQSIQEKMLNTSRKFDFSMEISKQSCDEYINELTKLRNSLSGDFKNLAALQGMDVKARQCSLDFKASCVKNSEDLNRIVHDEVTTTIQFARDFRKVCPPQAEGIKGGYSESEISEISNLVEQQCVEIEEYRKQWLQTIEELIEQQNQSLKCQDEFVAKYEKCTQEVAMAEGLGQKYGAPRRRAQEKIRTEVSRDEQRAGKLDELLARLEFLCAEATNQKIVNSDATGSLDQEKKLQSNSSLLPSNKTNNMLTLKTKKVAFQNDTTSNDIVTTVETSAEEELDTLHLVWKLLCQVKFAFLKRASYLKVLHEEVSIDFKTVVNQALPWIAIKNDQKHQTENTESVYEFDVALEEMFQNVDVACRKETKDLYAVEGKNAGLGSEGIPESLSHWLKESKNKVLVYKEKAWKKLWSQVAKSEELLSRHQAIVAHNDEEDEVETEKENTAKTLSLTKPMKVSVAMVCMKYLTRSFISSTTIDRKQKIESFSKLLSVWEKGREKHERLLRPKLGSPDAIEELNALDINESLRSNELIENVKKFRCSLVRFQVDCLKTFYTDVATCSKGLLLLIDATVRQELLHVPPGTEVPKKHMTLKRLRKAQRIKDEVLQGNEDRSSTRVWPPIDATFAMSCITSYEDLVPDLGSFPSDMEESESSTAAALTSAPTDKKNVKKPPVATSKNSEPEVKNNKPSLLPNSWIKKLSQLSQVAALVSGAQRKVIIERDAAIATYTQHVAEELNDTREEYTRIIQQEESWIERWKKQVDMLRKGNI